jgi:hypothetical protein
MGTNMGMGGAGVGGMRLGMGPIGMAGTGAGMGGMVAAGVRRVWVGAAAGAGAAGMGMGGMGMRQGNMGMMGWRRWAWEAGDESGSGTCKGHESRTAWVPPVCAVIQVVVVPFYLGGIGCTCRALFFHLSTTTTKLPICIEFPCLFVLVCNRETVDILRLSYSNDIKLEHRLRTNPSRPPY